MPIPNKDGYIPFVINYSFEGTYSTFIILNSLYTIPSTAPFVCHYACRMVENRPSSVTQNALNIGVIYISTYMAS